ncbi:unnamed protein product [Choristocarpus tenellus]
MYFGLSWVTQHLVFLLALHAYLTAVFSLVGLSTYAGRTPSKRALPLQAPARACHQRAGSDDGVLTAIITGANRGLGFALAERMSLLGHRVVLTCRGEDEGRAALNLLRERSLGDRLSFYPLDVANEKSVRDFRHVCVEGYLGGRVDVIFNNAGVCLEGCTSAVLLTTLAVNFYGALRVMDACLPSMCQMGKGSVVWVTSGDGELCNLGSYPRNLLEGAKSRQVSVSPAVDVEAAIEKIISRYCHANDCEEEIAFGPTPAYSLSKAAANAVVRTEGDALMTTSGVLLAAVCPGDVLTRMCSVPLGEERQGLQSQGESGAQVISPAVAAQAVVKVALQQDVYPGGHFYRDGIRIPW